MRKRFTACFGLLLLILAVSVPAGAQDDGSLAASIPVSAAVYVEVDLTAEAKLQALVRVIDIVSGNEANLETDLENASVRALFESMPDIDYAEVEPWLGDSASVALFAPDDELSYDHLLIMFPASDPATLTEHRDALMANYTEVATEGDAAIYEFVLGYQFAVLPDALWIGSPDELNLALELRNGSGDALTDNDIFNRLWAQLPADAPLKIGVSGRLLRHQAGEESAAQFSQALQIMLRLNPSESEAETALMNTEWIDSVGAGIDLVDNQLQITALALVDAEYAAPTLSSETAGAALLDYLPGDTMFLLDSYDAGIVTLSGLLLTAPTISTSFETIAASLADSTPAATPTPPPTPTVDEVIEEQVSPALKQVETILGVSMDEIFSLLSGEYAFAIFGGLEGPVMGTDTGGISGAIWIQTSDPARFIALLDAGMQSAVQMTSVTSSPIERTTERYNNVQVILWSEPSSSTSDSLAYGILSDDVVFITLGSTAPVVTQASLGDGVLPQSDDFPSEIVESMGTGNEALLYVDPAAISTFIGTPGLSSLGSIVATIDARDDGVFVLRMVIPLAQA